jgi:hypothetical protein
MFIHYEFFAYLYVIFDPASLPEEVGKALLSICHSDILESVERL